MSKVFVGGSRRLSRLGKDVRLRLDNIVNKGLTVLVGDANGADRAVQRYLADRRYDNVVVFCTAGRCRNNLGDWPAHPIAPLDDARRDFAYYATKDRAMVNETDYGLMLWDGKSRGTLTNIVHLVRQRKPVVVYVAARRTFHSLTKPEDLADLLHRIDPTLLHRIDDEVKAAASWTSRRIGGERGARQTSLF